jgi:hypothetical protein
VLSPPTLPFCALHLLHFAHNYIDCCVCLHGESGGFPLPGLLLVERALPLGLHLGASRVALGLVAKVARVDAAVFAVEAGNTLLRVMRFGLQHRIGVRKGKGMIIIIIVIIKIIIIITTIIIILIET